MLLLLGLQGIKTAKQVKLPETISKMAPKLITLISLLIQLINCKTGLLTNCYFDEHGLCLDEQPNEIRILAYYLLITCG
jgi:hypothetical protein